MQDTFSTWQGKVMALIPGEMIYTIELKPLWKANHDPAEAVRIAREARLIHKRGTRDAPAQVVHRGLGRPLTVGVRRKPLWDRVTIEAKVKTAIFAVLAEAETHRLEPDGVDYVRAMKRRLLEN